MSIDPRSLLVGAGPKPSPPIIVQHPETHEKYAIPQAAVAIIADNIVVALVNAISENVTLNVVSNVMRVLKDRCHFPIGTTVCGVTRAMHNVPKHDFVEPPPPPQAPPADVPTIEPETAKEEPHGEDAAQTTSA